MKETAYSEILDGDVIARLSGQFLHARQPMVGSIVGHHKSPYRGSSVEFAEYRKYVPGDDPRLLDWRVYARTDRFYVKEFEAEDGKIEAKCTDAENKLWEVYIDPKSGKVTNVKNED